MSIVCVFSSIRLYASDAISSPGTTAIFSPLRTQSHAWLSMWWNCHTNSRARLCMRSGGGKSLSELEIASLLSVNVFRSESRNIEQQMASTYRKASHIHMRTAFRLPSYSRKIQTYYLLFNSFTLYDSRQPENSFESSHLILSYAFNTFAIMRHICVIQRYVLRARRHICVTLLITHIRVHVDYQLFIYQLLYLLNDYSYMCFILHVCTRKYVRYIT